MSAWVIYSTTTGEIVISTDGIAAPGAGQAAMEVPVVIKPSRWRVDPTTMALVEVEPPAPDPLVILRRERNRLLIATDWTRLDDTDLTTEQREEARAYRAALRTAPETGALPNPPPWLFPGA